ncbi:MAG TPA: hypothetical protein VGJ59_19865 [Jatrophihabitantaceae bacterium]|jgi:hypothetical protein
MAESAMRAAGFWPRHTLQVATQVLPGSTRDRYRQEFLAELYGLGRARQFHHTAGVLSRSWALRAAINTPPEEAAADMEIVFPRHRRPLSCRLNLRHRWATLRTEDGRLYQQCQRCGKDETDIFAGTKSRPEFDGVPPGIGSAAFHGPSGSA